MGANFGELTTKPHLANANVYNGINIEQGVLAVKKLRLIYGNSPMFPPSNFPSIRYIYKLLQQLTYLRLEGPKIKETSRILTATSPR